MVNSFIHDQVIEIWKTFCELHYKLYDATCDEYQLLLEGRIEDLEERIKGKVELIKVIKSKETERQNLIERINEKNEDEIKSIQDLLGYMTSNKVSKEYRSHLERYNNLLIDIINKIQEQNKKNQVFINKSIHNLRSMREEMSGSKSLPVYGPNGKESKAVTR